MPIHYVKTYPSFEKHFDKVLPTLSVLFFDPCRERSATSIGDRFRRIDPSLRGNADIFIIRLGYEDSLDAISADSVFQEIAGQTPTYVLGFTSKGEPNIDRLPSMELTPLPWNRHSPNELPHLETLREVEVLAILERSEAISNGADNHHFVLPSGHHARRFIRLGDALRDPIEVRRIADWIMPYVRPNSIILADSGSILSLPLVLQARAASKRHWQVEIEALDIYPGDTEAISHMIDAVVARKAGLNPHLLFLISISSSGRLLRLFRSLTHDKDDVVIMCDTAEDATRIATESSITFARYSIPRLAVDKSGNCEECPNLMKIDIHPRTYQAIPNRDRELVMLTWEKADKHKAFWELADAEGAVRLHANIEYLEGEAIHSRHLAVYLDIPKLLNNVMFRAECIAKLTKIKTPDHVIIPRHGASEAVAALVLEAYRYADQPLLRECVHIVNSGRLPSDVAAAAAASGRILVADDALVNGGTLSGLCTELYRVTQGNERRPKVEAFVVIARPGDELALHTVRRRYRDDHGGHFHHGRLLYLPHGKEIDHGQESCPWCFESKLIRRYLPKLHGTALKHAEARLEALSGEIRVPALVVPNLLRSTHELPVTRGSSFGDLHPFAAFAAGACAAQQLRVEIEGQDERHQAVDVKMLVDSYYESILFGAIFRTLPARLLGWDGQNEPVAESISALDTSRTCHGTIPEMGWAAICGKLPKQAVRELLGRAGDSDSRLEMLRSILDIQLRSMS